MALTKKEFQKRFKLDKVVGEGAQAVVKSAYDRVKKVQVAVKIF